MTKTTIKMMRIMIAGIEQTIEQCDDDSDTNAYEDDRLSHNGDDDKDDGNDDDGDEDVIDEVRMMTVMNC